MGEEERLGTPHPLSMQVAKEVLLTRPSPHLQSPFHLVAKKATP